MTTKDPQHAPSKTADRSEYRDYRAPELREFGAVGALTQNGSMMGMESFMMGQIVTMMMN